MKLLDPAAVFAPDDPAALIGGAGEVLAEVESTMDVARRRLLEGAPDGYVVLAEAQAAGRGREGEWHCPPGRGLLLSAVLRVNLASEDQRLLGIMGAVAGAEAVAHFGVAAGIKWPNDVVIARPGAGPPRVRKLGGVLVEAVPRGDAAPAHVLGIGLNVNQTAEELPQEVSPPATSMRVARGGELDRAAVCRVLLRELSGWYRRLAMGQHEHVLARWRRRSCLLGRQVRASVDGTILSGTVTGIRSTGELILQTAGRRQVFLSERRTRLLL